MLTHGVQKSVYIPVNGRERKSSNDKSGCKGSHSDMIPRFSGFTRLLLPESLDFVLTLKSGQIAGRSDLKWQVSCGLRDGGQKHFQRSRRFGGKLAGPVLKVLTIRNEWGSHQAVSKRDMTIELPVLNGSTSLHVPYFYVRQWRPLSEQSIVNTINNLQLLRPTLWGWRVTLFFF